MLKSKDFLRNTSGNMSVMTAVFGLPLIMGVMLAMDIQSGHAEVSSLQDALDSAALSAVMKGSATPEIREAHAVQVFNENYAGKLNVKVNAKSYDERLTIKAAGQFNTSVGSLAGLKKINVANQATAEIVAETVTCLLILDPSGKKAMTFGGDSIFDSPNCAIQVNSNHHQGLWGGSNVGPKAADICVTGGYYGRFENHVKTDCRPIADPYKDRIVPVAGPCIDVPGVTLETPINAGSLHEIPVTVMHKTSTYTVLNPGNYCDGIKLNGKVIFNPGIYHISDGALVMGKTAKAFADNVTFIFEGKGSRLHMQAGSEASVNASKEGEMAGVAFYQVPNKGAKYPETTSLIRAGGDLNVNGVIYFPSHHIFMTGDAQLGAKAKATSFIAYSMYINADVRTTIEVDHVAAGLPPIEPRTDEGARLVQE